MRQPIAVITVLAVLASPLAAAAAPGDLPTDPSERAAACAAAIALSSGALDGQPVAVATADRIGHFALIGTEGDAERMAPFGATLKAAVQALNGDKAMAKMRVAACDRAYPRTLPEAPARLPSDPLDRGFACLIVGGTLQGIHQGMGVTDPEVAKYARVAEGVATKMGPQLDAAGLATQDAVAARARAVGKSAGDFGPPMKVADACLKEFG